MSFLGDNLIFILIFGMNFCFKERVFFFFSDIILLFFFEVDFFIVFLMNFLCLLLVYILFVILVNICLFLDEIELLFEIELGDIVLVKEFFDFLLFFLF